jgi:hypothetical protein
MRCQQKVEPRTTSVSLAPLSTPGVVEGKARRRVLLFNFVSIPNNRPFKTQSQQLQIRYILTKYRIDAGLEVLGGNIAGRYVGKVVTKSGILLDPS